MSNETNEPSDTRGERRNEHVTDLLGSYALGALDPDEVEHVKRHIQHCRECRADLAAYEEVTDLLAWASPARPVPVRARAGLLARIDQIGTPNSKQMIALSPRSRVERRPSRTTVPLSPRTAAFAVAPLALILVLVVVMAAIINDKQEKIEQIQAQQDTATRIVASAADAPNSDTRFTASPAGGNVQGRLLIDWEMNQMMIVAVDLPNLNEGSQYVSWLRIRGDSVHVYGGILSVDEIGRGQLIIRPQDTISNYAEVVVTIEPDQESPILTGPQVMTARIMPPR